MLLLSIAALHCSGEQLSDSPSNLQLAPADSPQAELTATAASLTALAISPSTAQVIQGLTQSFTATAHFSDGTTQDVTRSATWSIRDVTGTAVAIVSSVGVVTAQHPGKARVSARYRTRGASTNLEVITPVLVSLSLSPSNPTILPGSSQLFRASATYSNGSVQDVTAHSAWSVVDLVGTGVSSVSHGLASGNREGKASIIARYLGQTASTVLTVQAAMAARWTSQSSGTTDTRRSVWGSDAKNVVAVGERGSISKWNGTLWNTPAGRTTALTGVWGSDADHVWAVSLLGDILKWDGGAWRYDLGFPMGLGGIWGTDANQVWAVGNAGTIV